MRGELGDLFRKLIDHFVGEADLFVERELFVGVEIESSEGEGLLEELLLIGFYYYFFYRKLDGFRGFLGQLG